MTDAKRSFAAVRSRTEFGNERDISCDCQRYFFPDPLSPAAAAFSSLSFKAAELMQ
jgi:hypothetical protein